MSLPYSKPSNASSSHSSRCQRLCKGTQAPQGVFPAPITSLNGSPLSFCPPALLGSCGSPNTPGVPTFPKAEPLPLFCLRSVTARRMLEEGRKFRSLFSLQYPHHLEQCLA